MEKRHSAHQKPHSKLAAHMHIPQQPEPFEPLAHLRRAQPAWAALPVAERLAVLARTRRALARAPEPFLHAVAALGRKTVAEVATAELLPLLAALKHLHRATPKVLAPQRHGAWGRPLWLWGHRAVVQAEPHGTVLILAPFNYPLLLPGVQLLQALAVGNAVAVKPAPGCGAVLHLLAGVLRQAGLPEGVLTILPEDLATAQAATRAGFDFCILTGGLATGQQVLTQLATTVTPACVELSGHDAMLVLPGANLKHVAQSLRFGLLLNGGATCIAPRRVLVPAGQAEALQTELAALTGWVWAGAQPLPPLADDLQARLTAAQAGGATLLTLGAATFVFNPSLKSSLLTHDHFAPVASVVAYHGLDEALALLQQCPFRLGASVFGPPAAAQAVAGQLPAQVVTINNLIVPTADPRLPFGGSGAAGFGVTRGTAGLRQLTKLRVITMGGSQLHLSQRPVPLGPLKALMRWLYG
jgi:acyl-CoA reductase-like NAD-dependent aldehyde dehydrogenase